MNFELSVPPVEGLTTDEIVEAFIKELKMHETSEWPANRQKYVSFGSDPSRPYELELRAIAGELRSYPQKAVDGKWYADVKIWNGDAGKKVRTLIPYMKQAGNPMVALMDGIEDMAIPGKVFNLHIMLGQVPPHMK
jgi:hypothetical protein